MNMRIRSPGYPSVSIKEAIDLAEKIFNVSRQNVIDREAAAKDIGYSGLTGQSAKMLSNLSHYDLIEKSGKGGLRLTDTAVKILHPRSQEERRSALIHAAYTPTLFNEIRQHWPDGFISEHALRTYLLRNGFGSVAVDPAMNSYLETYRFLQQERATESYGQPPGDDQNAQREPIEPGKGTENRDAAGVPQVPTIRTLHQTEHRTEGQKLMDGERVVFVEEGGPAQYLKLVASGDLDETLLEALEDYIKRQKKRLAVSRPPAAN